LEEFEKAECPSIITATLRDYQLEGFENVKIIISLF
jgi:hypothetical protein